MSKKTNFKILPKPGNSPNEVQILHLSCGKTFVTDQSCVDETLTCPYCHKQRYHQEKTDAMFRNEVKETYGTRYKILSPYVNSRTKIKIECTKCGATKEILPYPFLHGYICQCEKPKRKKRLKRTTEEFKQEVFDLVGDEYEVLGEYEGANKKVLMRHCTCGHTFEIEPVRFLTGNVRCLHCNKNERKTPEEYRKEVFDLVGDDFRVLDDYVNATTKLRIQCNHCKNIKAYLPRNFLYAKRCSFCKHPKKIPDKGESS